MPRLEEEEEFTISFNRQSFGPAALLASFTAIITVDHGKLKLLTMNTVSSPEQQTAFISIKINRDYE